MATHECSVFTVANMCQLNSASEHADPGNQHIDSVLIRANTQDNCSCLVYVSGVKNEIPLYIKNLNLPLPYEDEC